MLWGFSHWQMNHLRKGAICKILTIRVQWRGGGGVKVRLSLVIFLMFFIKRLWTPTLLLILKKLIKTNPKFNRQILGKKLKKSATLGSQLRSRPFSSDIFWKTGKRIYSCFHKNPPRKLTQRLKVKKKRSKSARPVTFNRVAFPKFGYPAVSSEVGCRM